MSRNVAEQFELTLPEQDPLEIQWWKNSVAQADQWTDESLCIVWACDGFPDEDWWKGLPQYQRNAWLNRYLCERDMAAHWGRVPRSAKTVIAAEEEDYERYREWAERWAQEIDACFKAGTPLTIRPVAKYEWLLEWAFQISTVPRKCVVSRYDDGGIS